MNRPDFDTSWLEARIQDGIQAAGKKEPYHVCTVQLKLYDTLSDGAKKYLTGIARRENVKLEIVL